MVSRPIASSAFVAQTRRCRPCFSVQANRTFPEIAVFLPQRKSFVFFRNAGPPAQKAALRACQMRGGNPVLPGALTQIEGENHHDQTAP